MIFLIGILALVQADEYTLTVYENDFYSTPYLKYKSKSDETVQATIKLSVSATQYMVPPGDEQVRCMGSWNKLWGYSRCFGSQHHKDSDRFVFRRAQSCLEHKDGVVTEIPNCVESNLIELAAYAYDNSDEPFKHQGRLLKQFITKILPEQYYTYRLTYQATQTVYELINEAGVVLEIHIIEHRTCTLHKDGYRLELYFGGVCPAPINIEAHYIE